ncbi:MAG: chitin binding peritrophin-A domain-containing protein [Methylococcales bacterium]
MYPHPSKCGMYVQCDTAGVAYERECPADFHFNQETKRCDYPENAGCD